MMELHSSVAFTFQLEPCTVVSVRQKQHRIALWTKTASNEVRRCSFTQSADLGISLPAPSADALAATLYGHSTWRPLSCAER